MRRVPGRMVRLGLAVMSLVAASACSGGGDGGDVATGTTIPAARSVEGEVRIEGTFTKMVATLASFDAINPPFTIELPEVGRGGLQVAEAVVGGKLKSIVWSGGRPLPVTGTCSLDVGEADVIVEGGTLVVGLDGDYRTLNSGKCKFGTSVAVGDAESGELGAPVDSYSFNLDEAAEFTTEGGATIAADAARVYEGRRGQLGLIGKLKVTTEDDEYTAGRLGFDRGAWVATVTVAKDVMKVVVEGQGVVNFADE